MKNKLTADFLSVFDENRYPIEFSSRYEALECLSCRQDSETLLVRERDSGRLLVAKCYEAGTPLFEATEPEELRRLSNPGLPGFAGEYRSGTMRCILREYIVGKTLWEKAQETPFSEETVCSVGIQLCEILRYLHRQTPPVIHRDIKPQNIILREDGSLVLIDLGISRLYVKGACSDTVFCGTQDFAPPEQYGFLQTDCRSDIYSLGILLAWMLTGKARSVSTPGTPLERVIVKCTAFTPDDRFRDAAVVQRALRGTQPAVRKKKHIRNAAAGILILAILLAWNLFQKNSASIASVSVPAHETAAAQTATDEPSPEVEFTEPLIEEAVRLALDKDAGEPILQEDLAGVTALYINKDTACPDPETFYAEQSRWCEDGMRGRGPISSLQDLSLIPNLRIACIGVQQISDLSPLALLTALECVDLRFNDVSDLSPLAGLEALVEVGLNANPVADLLPLVGCKALRRLDLCDVTGNYDPSVLEKLGNLDFLDISNPTDSYLYLGNKSIRELKLSNTAFSDLSFLRNVKSLERLEVCNGLLSDLSELENHPELTSLRLCGIPALDYSVLLKLPNLETVTVGSDRKEQMEPIAAQAGFSVAYQ